MYTYWFTNTYRKLIYIYVDYIWIDTRKMVQSNEYWYSELQSPISFFYMQTYLRVV